MQHFAHKLVLVSFIVHMAMGCCLHHAHGHDSSTEQTARVSSCSHGGCGHSHDGHSQSDPAQRSNGGEHEGCDGSRCEFVQGGSVSADGVSAAWNCVAIDVLPSDDTSSATAKFFNQHPPRPPASLGLDILNQVMLL